MARMLAVVTVAACLAFAAFDAEAVPAPSTGAVSEAGCVYPDPYTVLGRAIAGLDKVEFLSLPGGRTEELRWLFISWEGPLDGAVYVLGCNGRVIANLPLGYIRQTKPGPVVDGHDTLQVIYVPATGTGIRAESVALLQFDGTSISKLWDHESDDVAVASHAMFDGPPTDYRLMSEAYHYDWKYSKFGNEITVSGKMTDELGGRIKRKILPREKFCYNVKKRQFQRCR